MGDVAFVVVTGFRLCGAADQYEKENQKQLHRCRKSQLSRFHYPQKARTEAEPGLLLTPHGKWIQIPYSDVMPGFGLNASGSRPLAAYGLESTAYGPQSAPTSPLLDIMSLTGRKKGL